jgi:hypothetical protein
VRSGSISVDCPQQFGKRYAAAIVIRWSFCAKQPFYLPSIPLLFIPITGLFIPILTNIAPLSLWFEAMSNRVKSVPPHAAEYPDCSLLLKHLLLHSVVNQDEVRKLTIVVIVVVIYP